jgi:hypothetical protein
MRKSVTSLASALALLVVLPVAAVAQASQLEGTWRLNVAKSKYSPGPGPKSQTLRWERVPGGYRFTTDAVNAEGQPTKTETLLKDDGSDAPVKGSPNPTTRYLKRIDDRTFEDGDKVNGKPTVMRRLVVSPDGKTLIITGKGTNAQGQAVNNVTVYERQ